MPGVRPEPRQNLAIFDSATGLDHVAPHGQRHGHHAAGRSQGGHGPARRQVHQGQHDQGQQPRPGRRRDRQGGDLLRRAHLQRLGQRPCLVGSHLLVGGKFRTVGGKARTALVSLSPTTGKDDAWVSIAFDGHHNWRGTTPTDAKAAVGIAKMATNPAGTQLVVVGNFTKVGGLARDQMAVVDLTAAKPRPSAWATTSLSSTCNRKKWDSWVRDVAVSADGTYAVVVSTGGPNAGTLCDAAARFALNTRARDVPPTWVTSTGGDTLISLALGERVVYVGGHMRWLNNSGAPTTRAPEPCPDPRWPRSTRRPGCRTPGTRVATRGAWASRPCCSQPRGCTSAATPTTSGTRPTSGHGSPSCHWPGSRLPSTAPPAAPDVYRAGATLAPGEVQRLHVGAGGATSSGRRPSRAASTGPVCVAPSRSATSCGPRGRTAAWCGRRSTARPSAPGRVAAVGRPCLVRAADRLRGRRGVPRSGLQPGRRAPRRDGPDVLRRAALLHPQRQHGLARALVQRRERHRRRPFDRRARRGRPDDHDRDVRPGVVGLPGRLRRDALPAGTARPDVRRPTSLSSVDPGSTASTGVAPCSSPGWVPRSPDPPGQVRPGR